MQFFYISNHYTVYETPPRFDMKRRNETEITALILGAVYKPGVNRTRIMYEAFLSFHQIKDYLSVLTKKGLIEYQRGDMTYRITDKGKDILEKM